MPMQPVLGCHHLGCNGKTDVRDLSDCSVTPMEISLWNHHLTLKLNLLPGPTEWQVVLIPHEVLITEGMLFLGTANIMLASEELTDSN